MALTFGAICILICFIGPPILKTNISINIPENSTNVLIDLSDQHNIVFPNPQYYALKKDRHLLATPDDINITLSSYSVLFQNLSRASSGNYSMTIQNYELDLSKEVGTFTSTFKVNVLCEFCYLKYSWLLQFPLFHIRWSRDSTSYKEILCTFWRLSVSNMWLQAG